MSAFGFLIKLLIHLAVLQIGRVSIDGAAQFPQGICQLAAEFEGSSQLEVVGGVRIQFDRRAQRG